MLGGAAVAFCVGEAGSQRPAVWLVGGLAVATGALAAWVLARQRRRVALAESLFRAVFDGTSDAVLVRDRSGVLVGANPAAQRLFRAGPDELEGRRSDDVLEIKSGAPDRHGGSSVSAELDGTVRRFDGHQLPVSVRLGAVEISGVSHLVISLRDVSRQRAAEESARDAFESLEQRVRERTIELEDANRELSESEERYRRLVESSPDGVVVLAGGLIVFANGAAVEMTGYPLERVIGRPALEFLPADVSSEALARLDATGEQRVSFSELRLIRVDGSVLDVEAAPIATVFGGEPAVQVTLRDLSERHRAERERRRLVREVEAAALVASELLAAADPLTAAPRIVEVLASAAEASDCSWYEVSKEPDGTFVERRVTSRSATDEEARPLLDRARVDEFPVLAGAMTAGETIAGTVTTLPAELRPGVRAAGIRSALLIPVLVRGQWRGAIGFTDRATERAWREEEIHMLRAGAQAFALALERMENDKQRAELAAVVEQAAEGVLIADRDARIRYVNSAFSAISGYPREEVLGRSPSMLRDPGEDPEVYAEQLVALGQGRAWRGIVSNRRRDGSRFSDQVTLFPLHDDRGDTVGFASIHVDISEQIALQEQLRRAQRMEAVGQLAGGIAHDFNNLVTIMLSGIDLLERDEVVREAGGEELDTLRRGAERAREITRGLLAFARQQHLEPVSLELDHLLDEVMPLLRRLLPEHIELIWQAGRTGACVRADRGQIEQVVLNLAVNARDAMPDGGRLTLTTDVVAIGNGFTAARPWARAGEFVRLRVSDTGIGMDEATRARIFDPFFTTKEVGRGTGLGLATTYGIVKQHEGFIDVVSAPGEGTMFEILFPPTQPVAAPEPIVETAAGGSESILIVEDQADLGRMLAKLLALEGYRVLLATDGVEALEILAREAIDLVLTDVVMPRMSGWELRERCRQLAPDTVFVLSSGYDEQGFRDSFPGELDAAFLAKPYDSATLLRKVRELLDARPAPAAAG